jgi:hypothetical protein
MRITRRVKAVARAQMATGVGIIVFWVLFFTVGLAPANPPTCYFAFERAFPLPDAVLALGLLAAGALVMTGRPEGRTLGLVCAGGLVFLGLLDASFNIQNGIYTSSLSEGTMAAAINLWCIALGIAIAVVMRPPQGA